MAKGEIPGTVQLVSHGPELLRIGYDNAVPKARVIGILSAAGQGAKHLRDQADKAGKLIDVKHGRKCRALVLMFSGHVYASGIAAETLQQRFERPGNCEVPGTDEHGQTRTNTDLHGQEKS